MITPGKAVRVPGMASWEFRHDVIPVYHIGGHEYMAFSRPAASALHKIRHRIDDLCHNLAQSEHPECDHSAVNLFLSVHNPDKPSYTLNEMPSGVNFVGLNKPVGVVHTHGAPPIGPDGRLRACARDIFLDLSVDDIEDLVIHELAHTMANHVTFREDDHADDFTRCEDIIKAHWVSG